MRRVQQAKIEDDLFNKMVFITGPRQVGKTWLAKQIAKGYTNPVYLNYDSIADRQLISQTSWLPQTDLLILDEIHKMPQWKNYLKGLYDTKEPHLHILVTGSARLETFRASGDSLAGRYFRHRLNPLSILEISNSLANERDGNHAVDLDRLMERGGFPEPYLASSAVDASRWRMQYIDGLIRTDILDFEKVHDFKAIQLTLEMLRNRVGSPISFSSLARDIGCSANTIKRYIEVLESLFIIFRVPPYHKNIARSILKEPKIYFYDIGLVSGNEGLRFENLVALSLMKHVNAIEDYKGQRARLNYLRTKDKREVDFALDIEGQDVHLIEVKLSDQQVSKSLRYFQQKYDLPASQIVKHLKHEHLVDNIEVRRADKFLMSLFI